jgi:DNA-binding MarR family transcriptional regulator
MVRTCRIKLKLDLKPQRFMHYLFMLSMSFMVGKKILDFFSLDAKLIAMKQANQTIIDRIFTVMNTMLFIEKRFSFTFKNVTLFPKEVHVILLVHAEHNINAKKIAEILGVTKGAISQTLKRLVDKGMLNKNKNPQQPKELLITLTNLGQEAANHFLTIKNSMAKKYDAYLANLSPKERKTIDTFLQEMDRILKEA